MWVAAGSALWLGILTSISPCPLASNIAAVSYIGKRLDRPSHILVSGLLYTLGRTITYVALAALIVMATMAVPDLARFLQHYMNRLMGPLLILVGLFLLGLIRFSTRGGGISERLGNKVAGFGLAGAGLLGMLFALSFCPVSAALYFGSLIPIALERESSLLIPALYGIGTALPVVGFAVLLAVGAQFVGKAYSRLTQIEKWARLITGAVFVLVGIYYSLIYLAGVDL
jgi:cytochrome c biogenesis protein CcdA